MNLPAGWFTWWRSRASQPAGDLPGRLVEPEQVFAAGVDAVGGAARLVRGSAGPLDGAGRALGGEPEPGDDLRQAGRVRLVHLLAAGRPGVRHALDLEHRRGEPHAVRPARGRVGDHRRLSHRVLRHAVRAVLPGRVPERLRRELPGDGAVPGRRDADSVRRVSHDVLDAAQARLPAYIIVDSILLVGLHGQGALLHLPDVLGPGDPAADAGRPADEFRLEVPGAAGDRQYPGGGDLVRDRDPARVALYLGNWVKGTSSRPIVCRDLCSCSRSDRARAGSVGRLAETGSRGLPVGEPASDSD